MTRLRLEVKDPAKVDIDALGKVNKVLKVVQVGQQFQCVFGPQVSDVYKDFCEVAGLEQQAMVDDEPDGAPVEKKPRTSRPRAFSTPSSTTSPAASSRCLWASSPQA